MTEKDKSRTFRTNGDAARLAREAAGFTQSDAAFEWEISERTIRDIETGKGASNTKIKVFAEKCGITNWHDLLADDEKARLRAASPAPQPVSAAPHAPEPAPHVVSRLFQLPGVVADFTGRADEIRQMESLLRGDDGRVAVSALRGMGGVGKTSLAVKVAHAVRDHFPDAQIIIELLGTSDRPVTPVEAMSRIIRDFHPDAAKLPDTEAELLPLYRSVLDGKRALIVLDNAKDEEQVKFLVTAPPPVGFVVTSRNALGLDGVKPIRLDVLPPDEALKLLREIVGAKGTDDELRTVAGLCGRLPLALRVAGDFLRLHANWSVPQYAEALREEGRRLERLKGKTKEKDVEAVLGLSAAELVKTNPEQAERWQMLAVFPADFDAEAAAAVWDLKTEDKLDTTTALDELTNLLDRSLLQFDEPTGRYSLHDLMRPVARDAFEFVEGHPLHAGSAERLQTAERRFAKHYEMVLSAANDLYRKGHDGVVRGLKLFDQEAANIQAGWTWANVNRKTDQLATELCRDYPLRAGHILDLRQPARTQIVWLECAVEACRSLSDRRGEGRALGNLGIAHRVLGDAHTAITFHQQTLAIFREIGDRREEGNALGNLGGAHRVLGDARTAITFYEQRLVIARELGDRWGEGAALGNLGNAHADLGDARTAITFYGQGLAIAREIGDRHAEAGTNWNMALALRKLEQLREAIPFAEQSLAFFDAIGHLRHVDMIRQMLAEWRAEAEATGAG